MLLIQAQSYHVPATSIRICLELEVPSGPRLALLLLILSYTAFPNHSIVSGENEMVVVVQDGQLDAGVHGFLHRSALHCAVRGADAVRIIES